MVNGLLLRLPKNKETAGLQCYSKHCRLGASMLSRLEPLQPTSQLSMQKHLSTTG